MAHCVERRTFRSPGGLVGDNYFYPSGVYHGFMPICVESVSFDKYLSMLKFEQ